MKRKRSQPRLPKLKPTDELKMKLADHTGDLIACWIKLSYNTPVYARWTCSLAIAIHMKRMPLIYIDRRELRNAQ